MLLSIVIPTRNRSGDLGKALAALHRALDSAMDTEVCVVDDASDCAESARNAALAAEFGFRYCRKESRAGPAHTRNTGIRETAGTWVAFLDDDVVVDDGWYGILARILSEASDDIVGIEGLTRGEGDGVWDHEVENLTGGLCLSCHIVYRRWALDQAGGFDEGFAGPFAEDQELALRVGGRGRIVFEKRLVALHMPRHIHGLSYVARSPLRMKELLDAEYRFYMRCRDSYHTCRHEPSFWRTLVSFLTRYVVSTLRRRSVRQLLRHPVQSGVLLLGSLVEQITAWGLAPCYVSRFLGDTSAGWLRDIDEKRTRAIWRIGPEAPLMCLRLRPRTVRALLFPFLRKPVYDARRVLRRVSCWQSGGVDARSQVFLRIDDLFSENLDAGTRMCEIPGKRGVPFLAAVPGRDLHDTSLLNVLRDAGGVVGLHGFSHEGRHGPYQSEILQMSFPQIDEHLAEVEGLGLQEDLQPVAFVPPFNAISWDQIVYLASRFRIVCGGPESARFTDCCFGPVCLKDGAAYFPSYYPFYGCARDIVRTGVPMLTRGVTRGPVCITVHVQEEVGDGFRSFLRLVEDVQPIASDWLQLGKAAGIETAVGEG